MHGTLTNGKPWANVLGLSFQGGAAVPSDSDIAAADAIFANIWYGTTYTGGQYWMRYCASTVQTLGTTWYRLDGTTPPLTFNHASTGQSVGTQELPGQTAFVLTVRTLKRGRQNRGRVYLPAPTTSATDGQGNLVQAEATAVLAQMSAVQNALNGVGVQIGVLSLGPYKAGQVPTPAPHFTAASSFTMDLKADVQRRRK